MEPEAVKLAMIVRSFTPDLYPFLTEDELESLIVLRDGLDQLDSQGALEIIQYSIAEHQKDALLH